MHRSTEACLDWLFTSVPAVRNYINRKNSAAVLKIFKNSNNWEDKTREHAYICFIRCLFFPLVITKFYSSICLSLWINYMANSDDKFSGHKMWFLLKITSWQSTHKKGKTKQIPKSLSWLHISPYLTKSSCFNSAQFSNMKEAESIVFHLALKNRSEKYLQAVVGSAHSHRGSLSCSGGWSTLGWVHALLSLFIPEQPLHLNAFECFSFFILLPDSFPDQCHAWSTNWVSQPRCLPKPKTSIASELDFLCGPHLISVFPHPPFLASPPSFFAKLARPHPNVPSDIPPSLGQLPTSPDSKSNISLLCPYLPLSSQLISHSFLLSYRPVWPQQGNTGAKGKQSGFCIPPSSAQHSGKLPSQGKPSSFARLHARPFLAADVLWSATGTERLRPPCCSFQSTLNFRSLCRQV